MKITLSKKQWELIGKKTGWIKSAIKENPNKIRKIIEDIKSGSDQYFSYKHFHSSNMADYSLMSSTINDMVAVYGISEEDAANIVQALTHE
jgi:hypothetical protein